MNHKILSTKILLGALCILLFATIANASILATASTDKTTLSTDEVGLLTIKIFNDSDTEAKEIILRAQADEAIRFIDGEEKTLFITKTGRPFLVRNIRSSVERYFELAGIKDATVNDLRHTWIFHHLSTGTPLVLISKLAGHKRLSTTEKYLKYVGEKKETSVKLEEL